jgi:phosphoribosyl transferase-like protein
MDQSSLVAPFRLSIGKNKSIKEVNGKPFDLNAYSRMKYGVRSDLRAFAHDLSAELLREAPQLFQGEKPPAILTSYKAAAPPATTLARYCLDTINLARFRTGLIAGEMVQVYRPQDYIQEYATLPESERAKLMGRQTKNTLRGRRLDDFIPVILDDIYVTGTYTRMMQQVLEGYNGLVTAYLAVCDESFKASPDAESMLNTSEIGRPSDLLPFIKNKDFVFTRRFLKMLLRTGPDELTEVAGQLPEDILEQVIRAIIDTDSELQHIFPEACGILLQQRA